MAYSFSSKVQGLERSARIDPLLRSWAGIQRRRSNPAAGGFPVFLSMWRDEGVKQKRQANQVNDWSKARRSDLPGFCLAVRRSERETGDDGGSLKPGGTLIPLYRWGSKSEEAHTRFGEAGGNRIIAQYGRAGSE
jgi:hypothetical protein